jgi:3-deoxy-D-arabino-heptulosonate 7-phosphate (DAHP) synthase class II
MTVSAQPDVVWDLLAEITNVGKWSPECVHTAEIIESRWQQLCSNMPATLAAMKAAAEAQGPEPG